MCSLDRRGRVFILTLTGDGDHRLSPATISSIRNALSVAKSESSSSGEGRFFSNGFDLSWARSDGSDSVARERLQSMGYLFRPLVADLLSLPMPTIAAVTGHASAAGFMLAICHDYVEMRGDRGFIYMSEIEIGIPFDPYTMALLRSKIRDRKVFREIVMEGKKIGGKEAMAKGIIDRVHGSAKETVEAAVRRAEEMVARNWIGEIYCSIRMGSLPEICSALGFPPETEEDRVKLLSLSKSKSKI